MSCKEQQEEELEVLESIYDGDEAFKQISPTCFQYKIGEDGTMKSFLLEIVWSEEYPECLPSVNLDAFFNKHISDTLKAAIVEKLKEEAEQLIGCAMTYTLFEYAKENADELMANQQEAVVQVRSESPVPEPQQTTGKPKQRKEQLSKAQKRKIINRTDQHGEYPRGYDWVDVIKHLSQTGRGAEKS